LLLSPRLGEAIFNLVYFHQFSMPVEVPSLAHGYIWFANGIIGAVMAGWMICIILLAGGPFLEGRVSAVCVRRNHPRIKAGWRDRWCTRVHLALSGHVYAKRRLRWAWLAAS